MTDKVKIKSRLQRTGWFSDPGVYTLVDGQFGSTGKGVVAGLLAELFHQKVDCVISNAGPNSGHTSYWEDEQIVLKQLPTFSVIANRAGTLIPTHLTAGAVIDLQILAKEVVEHQLLYLSVDPTAAVIDGETKALDRQTVHDIASTGQGVGPAIARKLQRRLSAVLRGTTERAEDWDPRVHALDYSRPVPGVPDGYGAMVHRRHVDPTKQRVWSEISQGFSLGINSGFYPYTTSRECSVSQALSDAGLAPQSAYKCVMALRTYPIRVGNTAGSSGPGYPDQKETSWEELGQKPETTTVTGRVRRVFTWSDMQFRHALWTNRPDVLFFNFLNYLPADQWEEWVDKRMAVYREEMGKDPDAVLLGTGPKSEDVLLY